MNDRPRVARISQMALVTAQPEALAAFLVAALDADLVDRRAENAAFAALLGLPDTRIMRTTLRIGTQDLALLAFDPPGAAYPGGSTSSDLWFQHFAVIVSDMDEAYGRLMRVGAIAPISQGGPRRLPPEAGGVVAFKFRDLEGHPLELLAFSKGEEPAAWRDAGGRLVQGIDHSAIAVGQADRSVRFFEDVLGLTLGPGSLNRGPEQAALDDVADARVSVQALLPASAPPHVELLGYEVGTRREIPARTSANDVAATILVMETEDVAAVAAAAQEARAPFVSPGLVDLGDGAGAILILDPDGHRILVRQPGA